MQPSCDRLVEKRETDSSRRASLTGTALDLPGPPEDGPSWGRVVTLFDGLGSWQIVFDVSALWWTPGGCEKSGLAVGFQAYESIQRPGLRDRQDRKGQRDSRIGSQGQAAAYREGRGSRRAWQG